MTTWQKTKHPKLKKRNGVYWARFMLRGVYIQESLNTESFDIAKAMLEDIERSILLGINWRKDKETFEGAWPDFLEDKARGNKTKIARQRTLLEYIKFGDRYFLPFFKDTKLADIEDKWTEYVSYVRNINSTILFFNHRKYINCFLSWSEKKGKIQKKPDLFDPDAKPDEDEEDDSVGLAYSETDLMKMRAFSLFIDREEFRLYMFMAMFIGMRSSEITQLRKRRIDWSKGMIRLKPIDTKNKQGRNIPIHPRVWAMLRYQCDRHQDSAFVFPNFRRAEGDRPMDPTGFKKPWNLIREELGIDGRFHDFKHTFITLALAKGMNPVIVSKVVGTSIGVIMKVYLHLRDEDLAAEMDKFNLGAIES